MNSLSNTNNFSKDSFSFFPDTILYNTYGAKVWL